MTRSAPFCLLVLALLGSAEARAAESYDNCTGVIASLPATIGTQGTWCLTGDLATAQASGIAIEVTTNNVTIDCNGFKLGGLAAGAATQATGIGATGRANLTVRNCAIRGFMTGVALTGGAGGHLLEDNRLDGITRTGLYVVGDNVVLRRNHVIDTGGSTVAEVNAASGIYLEGSGAVEDNRISGVESTGAVAARGVRGVDLVDSTIGHNRISGIASTFSRIGIEVGGESSRNSIRGNDIAAPGYGVLCNDDSSSIRDNAMGGVSIMSTGCDVGPGNHQF